jgi:hypothetical protein
VSSTDTGASRVARRDRTVSLDADRPAFDTPSVAGEERYAGILLGESLRPDAAVDLTDVDVTRVWRANAGDAAAGQPLSWTFIEFEIDASRAASLISRLASCLAAEGGWYASFASADEIVVVFADRSFRYRRGDAAARDEVEVYARSVGVPEAQLDWEGGP